MLPCEWTGDVIKAYVTKHFSYNHIAFDRWWYWKNAKLEKLVAKVIIRRSTTKFSQIDQAVANAKYKNWRHELEILNNLHNRILPEDKIRSEQQQLYAPRIASAIGNPEAVLMFNCGHNVVSLYTNCTVLAWLYQVGPSDDQSPAETPTFVRLWNNGLR